MKDAKYPTTYPKIRTVFKRDLKTYKVMENEFSLPEFEYLKGNEWVFTEKIDGTNVRIMWDGKNITFGGKTDNAQMPILLLKRLQELFGNRELFRQKFGEEGNVILFGEGFGKKIQAGGENYIKDGVDFILIDVRIGHYWLERENIEDIADYFGIKAVPIVGRGTLGEMAEMVKSGFKSRWGDFLAEGIVAKPRAELLSRKNERIITKLKYKDFNGKIK